jgi:16S rRNA (guanine527-N7)-methyltransferase
MLDPNHEQKMPQPRIIKSSDNPTFKLLRSLTATRPIKRQGLALISGTKVTREMVQVAKDRAIAWVYPGGETVAPGPELQEPNIELAPALFRELDEFGTGAPLLLVKVPEMPEFDEKAPWPKGATLFLALQNPENLGATIRSAAAFGVARIVLLQECAHPYHPKSMRAAGTALAVTHFESGPGIAHLSTEGHPLLTLDAGGTSLAEVSFPATFGLLPGVEGPGLPESLKKAGTLAIPMMEPIESLNAGVATAIALYEWQRQLSFRKDAAP